MIRRLSSRIGSKPTVSNPAAEAELKLLSDPRKIREQWLAHAGDFMEQSMRSPAFLTWLHYGLTLLNARSVWSGKSATPTPRVTTRHQGETVR